MSYMRAILNSYKWISPRLLPNHPGYKFVAKLVDGSTVHCETVRGEFAIRCQVKSYERESLKFSDIAEWREI